MYHYHSYDYGTSSVSEGLLGLSIAVLLGTILFGLIIGYVISSALYMLIFKKAGLETKKAWIPFYNTWTFVELGGQEGWKSLFLYIPYINIVGSVFLVLSAIEISKKLGKSPYFSILFVFLAPVWFLILGLDESRWNDLAGKESLAKGTILGYQVVSEEDSNETEEVKEAEIVSEPTEEKSSEEKTEE